MAVNLSLIFGAGYQGFSDQGVVLAGGLLYTYQGGTVSTPLTTYTDSTGGTPNANPIVLTSAGRIPNEVWLTAGTTCKFVVKTASGASVANGTWDYVPGCNDQTSLLAFEAALAASSGSSLVGFIQAGTGAGARTLQSKERETVNVNDFYANGVSGALVDPTGSVDSTLGIQAAITAVQGTGRELKMRGNYKITAPLVATSPIHIDGGMSQVYQQSANVNGFVFDRGLMTTGNYQYGFNVHDLVVATAAGTGNAFTFRNVIESTLRNLYVPGVGATAFHFQGCLLDDVEHLYTGNGLQASPGFFVGSLPTNTKGFLFEDYNGLGCNDNLIQRCTATNSTLTAFDVTGTGNTIVACDAEGITGTAVHMVLNGPTNVIGGDFEGNGQGIQVKASGCVIEGVNAATYVELFTGVHAAKMTGGTIKYVVIDAGATYNTVEDVQLAAGGLLVDNSVGNTNTKRNINSPSNVELGDYISGSFYPLLKLGGGNTGMTLYNNEGHYQRFGNLCYFQLWIYVNAVGSSTGAVTVDLNDFPWASANITSSQYAVIPCLTERVVAGAGNGDPIFTLANNSKIISAQVVAESTGVGAAIVDTAIAHLTQIRLSGVIAV